MPGGVRLGGPGSGAGGLGERLAGPEAGEAADPPGGLRERCLTKDPDERWRSAGDLAAELRWIVEEMVLPAGPESRKGARGGRAHIVWAGVSVALLAGFIWSLSRPQLPHLTGRPPARFAISLPPSQHVATVRDNRTLSLSRDGRLLAWIGGPPERRRVFLRDLDVLEIQEIAGTEGATPAPPEFSPDGARILFIREGALWSVGLDGGVPTRLLESDTPTGFWWAKWIDGETVIVSLAGSGLYRMSVRGGQLEPVTRLDKARGEVSHERPFVLPGRRAVLFAVGVGNWHDCHIEVVSLETGDRHTIIEEAFQAQYAASGHVLFGRDDTLFAVPFDLERLQVVGSEVAVLSPVQMDVGTGRTANFTISETGSLAYLPGDQGLGERRLEWWYRDGKIEPLPPEPGIYSSPRISPDGRQLAVTVRQGHRERLNLYDIARHVLTPLEQEGSWNARGVWSPGGDRLAFTSNRAGQWNLFVTSIRGSAQAVPLQKSAEIQNAGSWSPDGSLLAYINRSDEDQFDIWLLPMNEPSAEPIPFLVSRFNEISPAFSPDGRWLAYVSGEPGQPEIFVREVLPSNLTGGVRRRVSRDGGWYPVWARDGSELFYLSLDGRRILTTPNQPGPGLELGDEDVVLSLRHPWPGDWDAEDWPFDVAPDGERFLVVSRTRDQETLMDIVVALDWVQALDRLAPRGEQ